MNDTATETEQLMRNQIGARFFAVTTHAIRLPRRFVHAVRRFQIHRGPQAILKIVLGGTLILVSMLLLLLLVSFFVLDNTYVADRMVVCLAAFLYLFSSFILLKRQQFKQVAWMLIIFYGGLAATILSQWSINAPFGILILGFTIIMSGVLLGARFIIPVTIGAVTLLLITQIATEAGLLHPDHKALAIASSFGDVASYAVIFAVFALISWLAGRQKEQSLEQALQAEAALAREKELLAVRLEEQTRHLRDAQFEEIQHLYRFVELGQLSTVLLHDLANHLTVLTIDIDDLQQVSSRSDAVTRAKESISHLEKIVGQVRLQLQETSRTKEFNTARLIRETLSTMTSKARKTNVKLVFQSPISIKAFRITGDSLRLSQIITILVTNAIEAYADVESKKPRTVAVTTKATASKVRITVTDHGIGIPANRRAHLFLPFQSTKEHGMGIGLFIAKNMIATHFKGTVMIDANLAYTRFIIELPKQIRNK